MATGNTAAAPHYFAVRSVHLRSLSLNRVLRGTWRTLAGLPTGTHVESVNASGILLGVFPMANAQSKIWHDGLYLVNATTGQVRNVASFSANLQANVADVSGSWLVYEPGSAIKNGYHAIMAKNIQTGAQWTAMTLPGNVYSAGDIKGLTIRGHWAYWLANLLGPNGLTSTVYAYNLQNRQLHQLLHVGTHSNNRMFFTMAPAPGGLWISVNNSGDLHLANVNGSLWYWSFQQGRVTQRIPVWHAPTLLYGATRNLVIFSGNYRMVPSSFTNPGPYPVYAADAQTRTVYQLTSRINPGGAATISGPYLTVNGLGMVGALIDWNQKTRVTLPDPQAAVGGQTLVLQSAGDISWTTLIN